MAQNEEVDNRVADRREGLAAPRLGDIEKRAAELAARLAGAGSLPRKRPERAKIVSKPLPEWPSLEENTSSSARGGYGGESAGQGKSRSTGHDPKRAHYVTAVIHEEDRKMDQLDQQPFAKEADIRRWENDSRKDLDELRSAENAVEWAHGSEPANEFPEENGAAEASRPHADVTDATAATLSADRSSTENHSAAIEPVAAGVGASADQGNEAGGPRDAAPAEPDMSVALRDISQFIARQLHTRKTNADAGAADEMPAEAAEAAAEPQTIDGDVETDPKAESDLREIERQIRALSASMNEEEPDNDSLDGNEPTWQQADGNQAADSVAKAIEVVEELQSEASASTELLTDDESSSPEAVSFDVARLVDVSAEPEREALAQAETAEPIAGEAFSPFDDDQSDERNATDGPELNWVAEEVAELSLDSASGEDELDTFDGSGDELSADAAGPEVDELELGVVFAVDADSSILQGDSEAAFEKGAANTALVVRVEALEQQVVDLLQRVTENERRISETLLAGKERLTEENIAGAIATSSVVASLQGEMRGLNTSRQEYEAHTADSLDALHDALRELADRLQRLEHDSEAVSQSEEYVRGSAGIASSVLTSRIASEHAGPRAVGLDPGVSSGGEKGGEDHLPVWLEDSSPADTLSAHSHATVADVFASTPVAADNHHRDEHGEREAATGPAQSFVLLSEAEESRPRYRAENGSAGEVRCSRELPAETPSSALDDEEEEGVPYLADAPRPHTPRRQPQPQPASGGNNYLRSVRASVAARSTEMADAEVADSRSRARGGVSGSLIDAARKRDQEIHGERGVEVASQNGKDKGEKQEGRFNVLFIATALVLFLTSAMLLYGMNRREAGHGSVVKLDAAEERQNRIPLVPSNEGNSSHPAGKATEDGAAQIDGQSKRSEFDQGSDAGGWSGVFAPVAVADAGAGWDATSSAPRDIEITGALPDANSLHSASVDGATGLKAKIDKTLPEAIASATVRNAALADNSLAQYEIARNFEKGVGVKPDAAKAMPWYESSAQKGYAPSIYRMALLYERGAGVARNTDKAVELYLAAAEKGNVNAMHNLGVVYSGGQSSKTDYEEAVRWYTLAAEYGVKDSQVNLAIIYQNGLGVKRDLARAYRWYIIAADNGDGEARNMAEEMRGDIGKSERTAIEREAGRWKAKPVNSEANYQPAVVSAQGNVRIVMPSGE